MGTAVGLIGVGRVGSHVARALVASGYDVRVHDLDADRMTAIERARPVADAHLLARSVDVLICCVDGTEAAIGLALGHGDDGADRHDGVIEQLRPGSLCIELATLPVDAVQREAEACRVRDVGFVECPVSGQPSGLTALVGGADEDVARALPIVDTFSKRSFCLGQVGAASVAKLVNQFLTYANLMVAAQGLSVGARMGIAPAALAEALAWCAGASRSLALLTTVLSSGTSGFSDVHSIQHDIELYAALSRVSEQPSQTLEELRSIFADAARVDGARPFPVVFARYGIGL